MTSQFRFLPKPEKYDGVQKYLVDIKSVPHHVLVYYSNYYCSGSIIGSRTVLTSAICLYKWDGEQKIYVKMGTSSIMEFGTVIPVLEVKIHEFFQRLSTIDNDIALLYLESHVPFGKRVKKIFILDPEVSLHIDAALDVTSFADKNLSAKYYMGRLISSNFVVVDEERCREAFGDVMTPSNYCAKYNIESRVSDNGGAATSFDILVGILSYGGSSKHAPHLAIFTNASYFRRWIALNVKRFLIKYCSTDRK